LYCGCKKARTGRITVKKKEIKKKSDRRRKGRQVEEGK
jgi:hypothetical protein